MKTSSLLKQLPNRFKVTVPGVFHIRAVPVKRAGQEAGKVLSDFVPVSLRADLGSRVAIGFSWVQFRSPTCDEDFPF
jgi:hypothetical protein